MYEKGVLEMSCESFAYQIIHVKYVLKKKRKKKKENKSLLECGVQLLWLVL